MTYITLACGIALLLFSGDLFVRGAVALAVRLAIPTMVIGLTVVAFGTSAPELVISLDAALSGSPGLAIGNVVGSNIANVLLVLGLPAIIAATDCNQPFIRRNLFYVIGASVLFIAFSLTGTLSFWHGAVLFALMIGFLGVSAHRAMTDYRAARAAGGEVTELTEQPLPNAHMYLFLLAGIIGMPVGAHITVAGAVELAASLGVSQAAIGLTVVALSTSLPELATTISAALRRNCALALGNVLGSNLFNMLAIMGLTAMVTPVPVPDVFLRVDLWVMLAAVLAISPFVLQRIQITRLPGLILVLSYVVYIFVVYAPRMEDMARAQAG